MVIYLMGGDALPREGATIETVRQTVRHIRKTRGMSQQELAERAGVTQYTVSEIELGHRDPHPATLRKLAKALDVEVAEFFQEEAEVRPKARSRPSIKWLARARRFIQRFDRLGERDTPDYSASARAVSDGVHLLSHPPAKRNLTRAELEEVEVARARISEIFVRAADTLAGERAEEDVEGEGEGSRIA